MGVAGGADLRLVRGLRGYLAAVATAAGVGMESCTVDFGGTGAPMSAYIALDHRLPRFPDRDLALVWDERHGWALAVETHSGEDLIVLTYLDNGDVLPEPAEVASFLAAARANDPAPGRPDPPGHRRPGDQDALTDRLDRYRLADPGRNGASSSSLW
nr:DUF6292 family protein [Amycolatopsis nigrescens]